MQLAPAGPETRTVVAGEGFACLLNRRPCALVFIGNGDSEGLHHRRYDFADEAIPAGISYRVRLVERVLRAK